MNGSDFVLGVIAEVDITTFCYHGKYRSIKIADPVVLVILMRLFYVTKTMAAKKLTASVNASETKHQRHAASGKCNRTLKHMISKQESAKS